MNEQDKGIDNDRDETDKLDNDENKSNSVCRERLKVMEVVLETVVVVVEMMNMLLSSNELIKVGSVEDSNKGFDSEDNNDKNNCDHAIHAAQIHAAICCGISNPV